MVAGKATVKFFASPSSPFHGKVLSIQPAAIPSSNEQQTPTVFGTRLFTVFIEIAKPPFALKAVTGDAKISAGYQSLGCCWSVSRPVCSNRSLVVASQSDFRSLTLERTVFVPSSEQPRSDIPIGTIELESTNTPPFRLSMASIERYPQRAPAPSTTPATIPAGCPGFSIGSRRRVLTSASTGSGPAAGALGGSQRQKGLPP